MKKKRPSPAPQRRSAFPLARPVSCAVLTALLLPPPLWAQQGAGGASAPAPAVPSGPALNSRTPVTLNFVNAEIEAVTRAIAAMVDRQILVDPRVRGQITLYSEQPLTVRQAYQNYLAQLRGLGFTVVESGGLLKVVPEADAKLQAGTVQVGPPVQRGDQVLTQIFRLNHENPNNLVAVLRPLISPNNTINANPTTNTLVITDYADNLQRIGRIIAALDQPASTDVEIIPLRHAVASDVVTLVQRLADGGGAVGAVPGGAPGVGGAGGTSVLADPRSNSLLVRAASPARLAQIRATVEKLDRPMDGSSEAGNIRVVYLKNADAVRLATVLRAAFAAQAQPATGAGAAGAVATGGAAAPAAQQPIAAQTSFGATGSSSSTSTGLSAQATAPVQAVAQPSTGGFVQADPATNSLIITAPEPMYRQLRAVIEQLDSRRAQVYVESMIVRVDATKAAQFGFQWQGILGKEGDKNFLYSGTNYNANNIFNVIQGVNAAIGNGTTGSTSGGSLPGAGLNVGLVRRVNGVVTLVSLANFLQNEVGGNVLSTPNLVALDNEEAKIVVGQNVPFVTGTFTNTGTGTGAVNPFQTVERRDVGLTLRIRSQIGEAGTVRMTIFQENSAVVPGSTTSNGPTTDKSSIETTVVVDDGQVLVLGGLMRDEYADGEERVPGLADLPVVGNLFKSRNRQRVKSNLLVFLRPVVLRTPRDAESLSLDRYDAIRAMQEGGQPAPSVVTPVNDAPVLPVQPQVPGRGSPLVPVRPVAPERNTQPSPAVPGDTPPSPPTLPSEGPPAAQPQPVPEPRIETQPVR
ncbi:type II secretion system secretin GspD [Azohydromonas caseinilytica]|uniref:Type IV pilus biogenesis and competence protein PilQ n=1 Tax=Azohydromonas caseinilytica TaxID=2728836 RepID=A0A848F1B6_9BURK|nr:type II secretion system secretin GspD [Azohydromonas caseinilytica]NML13474.1 type II secretion system secretin GspD [Azohydromonas caseinilytica]